MPAAETSRIPAAARRLVQWFLPHRRDLPWRKEDAHERRDPYAVWISEIMLQQTQVDAVIQHYQRWMQRFPDIHTLAQASEPEVLRHWQGLGYYSRARNILRTAILVTQNHHGHFPRERRQLEALPGIGAYTAGAILSLAMRQAEPILDGNLVRIFSRLHGWDFLPDSKAFRDQYWDLAGQWCAAGPAHRINEALMELGALVCTPANPACHDCPLQSECHALHKQRWKELPPRKSTAATTWKGWALVISNTAGEIWCVRDPGSFFLKNQCNFPLAPSQTEDSAVAAMASYLQVAPSAVQNCKTAPRPVRHAITRYRLEITVVCLQDQHPSDPNGAWIPARELEKHIVNSLGLKIWQVAQTLT